MTTELDPFGLDFKRGWEAREKQQPLPHGASQAFVAGWIEANKQKTQGIPTYPRIIAKRYDDSYLVAFDGDTGQVFFSNTLQKAPPTNIQSILARGYWEQIPDGSPLARPLRDNPTLQNLMSYKLMAG